MYGAVAFCSHKEQLNVGESGCVGVKLKSGILSIVDVPFSGECRVIMIGGSLVIL